MRMTNKIMRNNSLYNINQNKLLEDKLSNQMTNQSKITRPSDDPVVAIRALRLRTNVATVTQYYDKNAPDADKWLTLTGDALDTVGSVLKSLYEKATEAAEKSYKSEDLEILLTQIEALTHEFYASGNVDYAGRYVFSGFRTDTPITFRQEDIKEFTSDPENLKTYVIEESMGYHDILSVSYTDWSKITSDATGYPEGDENDVKNTKLYRYRLSYDNLNLKTTDADGSTITYPMENTETPTTAPNAVDNVFQITDRSGTPLKVTAYADAESAYKALTDGSCKTDLAYVAATGEVVFNEDYYNKLNEGDGISVKYAKSNWQTGDINPVHYFKCIATDEEHADEAMTLSKEQEELQEAKRELSIAKKEKGDEIERAKKELEDAKTVLWMSPTDADALKKVDDLRDEIEKLEAEIAEAQEKVDKEQADVDKIMRNAIQYNPNGEDQDIYYNVGFNQTIQVNTHADEVFTHGAQRDMDDFTIYLKQLKDAEAKIANIEEKMKECAEDSPKYADYKKQLDAMNKAYTYIRDNVQKKFENQITRYQKYIDDTNVAVTNNGTRGSRLDLISDRLMNQKATFKDLQSNNEDVDVTEVAVQLKSSELTYEAALMATSKIMQTNLMNYI